MLKFIFSRNKHKYEFNMAPVNWTFAGDRVKSFVKKGETIAHPFQNQKDNQLPKIKFRQ